MGQPEETAAISLGQIQAPILDRVIDLAGQVTDLKWDLEQLGKRAENAIDSNKALRKDANDANRRANESEDRLKATNLQKDQLTSSHASLENRLASQTEIIACARALLDFEFENVGQLKLSLRAKVGATAKEEENVWIFDGYDKKGLAMFRPDESSLGECGAVKESPKG